jgi:RNA polymerase sigma-32 factor
MLGTSQTRLPAEDSDFFIAPLEDATLRGSLDAFSGGFPRDKPVGSTAGSRVAHLRSVPDFTEAIATDGSAAPGLPTTVRRQRADGGGESALGAYLSQLRRHPLMTRDEEHHAAVEFARTGDPSVAARLVTANLRLVVKIAREYGTGHHQLLDLIQEGNLGLVRAVQKYDPARGIKLSSYAAWWIRAYILKFALSNRRLVKIGTTQVQRRLFFRLGHEREKLERRGGSANPEQLAASLDATEGQVVEMEARLVAETRLDAPVRGHEQAPGSVGDFVRAAEEERPDAQIEAREFHALLRSKLATFEASLAERDLEIFRRRLLNDEPVTTVRMAHQFGISRQRVRQLEERLRLKLRRLLLDELGDVVGCT